MKSRLPLVVMLLLCGASVLHGQDAPKSNVTIPKLVKMVKPVYTSEAEDQRFTQPVAVYTVKPSIPGWHGQVICAVKIDEHGHVRDVDVKGTADEAVIKPVRAALMSWEYEPATINGHPSLGFVQVNVQ